MPRRRTEAPAPAAAFDSQAKRLLLLHATSFAFFDKWVALATDRQGALPPLPRLQNSRCSVDVLGGGGGGREAIEKAAGAVGIGEL